MAEYIVSGNIEIEVIHDPGGETRTIPGGNAMYGLSGLRVWTDSCAFTGYAGTDFYEDYGPWLDAAGIHACEPVPCFDRDLRKHLYFDDGGAVVRTEYEPGAPDGSFITRCSPTAEICRGYAGRHPGEIRGWLVQSHLNAAFLEQFRALASEYGFCAGCEFISLGSGSYVEPEKIVEDCVRCVDFFSVRLDDCIELIGEIKGLADAERFFLRFPQTAVFLRYGGGAEMIRGGRIFRAETCASGPEEPERGSLATAAAFWALCKGKDPLAAACAGIATAALYRKGGGLITDFGPETRSRCEETAAKLVSGIRSGKAGAEL